MKKTIISIMLVILCLASCAKSEENAPTVVATVNGENVMSTETDYFSGRLRSDVVNEYAEKYNITDFSDFWDKEFDGKTPNEYLSEKALNEAIKAKVELLKMKEYGIYEDISYAGLKQKAEDYNKAHASGSASPGLESIDTENFYTYYISNGELELKNRLAESELAPTDEEIKAYKEANSDYDGLTEQGIITAIVSGKFDGYVENLLEEAEITYPG